MQRSRSNFLLGKNNRTVHLLIRVYFTRPFKSSVTDNQLMESVVGEIIKTQIRSLYIYFFFFVTINALYCAIYFNIKKFGMKLNFFAGKCFENLMQVISYFFTNLNTYWKMIFEIIKVKWNYETILLLNKSFVKREIKALLRVIILIIMYNFLMKLFLVYCITRFFSVHPIIWHIPIIFGNIIF